MGFAFRRRARLGPSSTRKRPVLNRAAFVGQPPETDPLGDDTVMPKHIRVGTRDGSNVHSFRMGRDAHN